MKTIVLRQSGTSWCAYFAARRNTQGVAKSPGEAVASLLVQMVGKLVLRNPRRFGFRIALNSEVPRGA